MSVAELIAQGTSFLEVGLLCMSVYLTVVTGYLFAAYNAGRELSHFQLYTISSLFLAFSSILTLATFASLTSAINMFQATTQSSEQSWVFNSLSFSAYIAPAIQFVGIIAAMKFMSNVRNA